MGNLWGGLAHGVLIVLIVAIMDCVELVSIIFDHIPSGSTLWRRRSASSTDYEHKDRARLYHIHFQQ
jgi:hypothetical protein